MALNSGKYFDISQKNEYIDTLLLKCIDEYTSLRRQSESDESISIDPRMENIIDQMFQRCYRDSCFEQAVGIALDTRRIDKFTEICDKALSVGYENILTYG